MKRNLLNITTLILFLLTMSFYFLPKMLHEILGILWLAAVLCHLFLNRQWFSSLKKGRWTANRIIFVIINILLMVSMVVVMITGVFISNHLFKGWFGLELARNIMVRQLHVSLPFLMIILTGIHLGLHWKSLWNRFFNWLSIDKNSWRFRIVSYISSVILLAIGIYGSFLHRVGDRLLMKHIFATKATELNLAAFLLLLLGIFGLYVFIGYVAQRFLQKK